MQVGLPFEDTREADREEPNTADAGRRLQGTFGHKSNLGQKRTQK